MVLYFDNYETATFNGYSFRRDKKTGYFLSSVAIGNKRKRLHVYVWEYYNGNIPKGYHVHHIDGDKNNNEIENLCILTASQHEKLHMSEKSEEAKQQIKRNLIEKAVPKAVEWHKSAEGREWHKKHGVEVFANLEPVEYVCSYCHKHFKTKNRYGKDQNTFCSNNCKSAYRRMTGVDNIERECECCGKKFITNKYSKAKYCEVHRRKGSRN